MLLGKELLRSLGLLRDAQRSIPTQREKEQFFLTC